MRNKLFTVIIVICAFSMITFGFSADSFAKKRVIFGGGPAGGTFQVVANAIGFGGKFEENQRRETSDERRLLGTCLAGQKR
jgi:hypothetical protein